LTQAGSFASKNVGTGITVTAADSIGGTNAGNYTLVEPTGLKANITPASLTVSDETAANKVYNGNMVATLTGGTLKGVVTGDTVTLTQAGSFASKNVGKDISVNATDSLGGASAGNYILVQPTCLSASITPLAITVVATGTNRVYNGTVSDAVTLSSSGVIAGDVLNFGDSSATFANKNVGTGKAVTVTGIVATGTAASNYTLSNTTATTTANITAATLTVSSELATNKVYDGTTADTLIDGHLVGVISGDTVTLTQAGHFVTPNVGTNITVIVTDTIGGTGASNYTLTQPSGLSANITQSK
jgi:endonuclease YncB( thermonuclease family)